MERRWHEVRHSLVVSRSCLKICRAGMKRSRLFVSRHALKCVGLEL